MSEPSQIPRSRVLGFLNSTVSGPMNLDFCGEGPLGFKKGRRMGGHVCRLSAILLLRLVSYYFWQFSLRKLFPSSLRTANG